MSERGALGTSRRYIAHQYGDDRNLAARQAIYRYQRPRRDLHNASLDLAQLRGDETVVDVGCGNGRYLAALRARGHRGVVVGADLSEGMLRTAPAGTASLLLSDAQALPFRDAAVDVVLAMHMLYHVPDRAQAIAELRRVTRPDGVVLALANSKTHFQELEVLLAECAVAAVGSERARARPSLTLFTAENAVAQLSSAFTEVTANSFASELVVDAATPVVAYARSMGGFVVDGDDDEARKVVLAELERRLSAAIARDGAFRITTACTTFVCR
jgi:ubiquinone/menaquinone biosynthesis C-methylase UbiE